MAIVFRIPFNGTAGALVADALGALVPTTGPMSLSAAQSVFGGVSGFLENGSYIGYEGSGSFADPTRYTETTYSGWVRFPDFTFNYAILQSSSSPAENTSSFDLFTTTTGALTFRSTDPAGTPTDFTTASGVVAINTWFQFTLVVGVTTIELFINGVSRGSVARPANLGGGRTFRIGRGRNTVVSQTLSHPGIFLDEFSISDTADAPLVGEATNPPTPTIQAIRLLAHRTARVIPNQLIAFRNQIMPSEVKAQTIRAVGANRPVGSGGTAGISGTLRTLGALSPGRIIVYARGYMHPVAEVFSVDGTWTVPGLRPGPYTVVAVAGFTDDTLWESSQAKDVEAPASGVTFDLGSSGGGEGGGTRAFGFIA